MIAELGLAALWLAAALAALQLFAGAASFRANGAALAGLVRPVAIVQGLLTALSFSALIWLFARTDLSVALVANNSHSEKPMIFKLAGAWGNHEGSMLLWITVMAVAGALIAFVERRLPERTMVATLAAQAFVGLGFYAYILLASNPFERLADIPLQGAGLNPQLQDIGLAYHPTTFYIGYVGLSVAFSFVVGALVTRQVTPDFARAMRPWVLGAWMFLTLGITAGSYWAAYILGWGGWWFWDPVENGGLMPWLAATALLHSVSVLAARDALRTWTVMLGVLAFSMSMLGTFLVRSGILTSVHAFAVDPQRGSFILALLAIYIGGALALFVLRSGSVAEGERFSLVSREGALVINNVGMCAILAVVLFGTLYPLLTEALGFKVSVGPPYFNPVTAIFFLPMLLILTVGPLLRWRRDQLARIARPALAILALLVGVLGGVWALADVSLLSLLGMALGVAVAVASFLPMRGRSIRRLPLATWGMMISHFGIAFGLFGMAADTAFQQERLVAAQVGDVIEDGPWVITLQAVEPVAGSNWTGLEATLVARYDGGSESVVRPQKRSFWTPAQETSTSAMITRWNGQLYTVLGGETEDGRWQLRLAWKPFVTWIWYGGILIAFGGLLALIGRVATDLRRRRARTKGDERRADIAS
jgi:cytochrome c-type biogenesis protein CcmF